MSGDLVSVVALLAAAVVAVPLFQRLGLGSVLGYLAAGLAIGPFGLGWFADPHAILHVAELGVVMFLFVIGLEMRPSHLWSMRRDIFGLGTVQVVVCTALLTAVGFAFGWPLRTAAIGAMGFVLTSTAIVMQLLHERGEVAQPRGQHVVAILLFEDLMIVPLLAIVSLMAPTAAAPDGGSRLGAIGLAIGALAIVVAAGVWLLNPLFRVLAAARAREVMTAAALLVVLGAALVMQLGGLSMAMGAFVAGVLLAESTFRHQIEADIEPFRGLLLGLFFLGVGMSLDLAVVASSWALIAVGVVALMAVKGLGVYGVARLSRACHADALDRAVLMAQGGEFAFVLFAAAAQAGVIDREVNANLTAIVVLSMVLTPVALILLERLAPAVLESMEGVEVVDGQHGSVLIIGFGRFGQVTSQLLLARGVDVTIIDTDIEMITSAGKFGFKIYYGDGTRLDVLRASGAATARAIAVCIDKREATDHVVLLCKAEFPQARLLVRSFDREHAAKLVAAGVDVQVRETFESALRFGELALREIGVAAEEAAEVAADIRRRDLERFELELAAGDIAAGRDLMHHNAPLPPLAPTPTPFTTPAREAQLLSDAGGAAPTRPAR